LQRFSGFFFCFGWKRKYTIFDIFLCRIFSNDILLLSYYYRSYYQYTIKSTYQGK